MRLALVGFGHVGRAFARLLLRQRVVLQREFGLRYRVTAILTAHHGWAVEAGGLDLERLLDMDQLPGHEPAPDIATLPAYALIEVSTLDARTGQPALEHIRQVIIGDIGRALAIRSLPLLYQGAHGRLAQVRFTRARRVEIAAETTAEVQADGELVGQTPAVFEVIANALDMLTLID